MGDDQSAKPCTCWGRFNAYGRDTCPRHMQKRPLAQLADDAEFMDGADIDRELEG